MLFQTMQFFRAIWAPPLPQMALGGLLSLEAMVQLTTERPAPPEVVSSVHGPEFPVRRQLVRSMPDWARMMPPLRPTRLFSMMQFSMVLVELVEAEAIAPP